MQVTANPGQNELCGELIGCRFLVVKVQEFVDQTGLIALAKRLARVEAGIRLSNP